MANAYLCNLNNSSFVHLYMDTKAAATEDTGIRIFSSTLFIQAKTGNILDIYQQSE